MGTNKSGRTGVCTIQLIRKFLFHFLIFSFVVIFIMRVEKLTSQETGLSSKYEHNEGLSLPSYTFCFGPQKENSRFKGFEITPNFTFDDFMESSSSVKEYIYKANYYYKSPMTKETGARIDILDMEFDHLWEESFYLQSTLDYFGINRCLTLNSPEEKLGRFKNFFVSINYTTSFTN